MITPWRKHNIETGKGIFSQGKGLDNSRALSKVVAIYKTYKLILSKKVSEKSTLKRIEVRKNYLTQKVAAPNFSSYTNQ